MCLTWVHSELVVSRIVKELPLTTFSSGTKTIISYLVIISCYKQQEYDQQTLSFGYCHTLSLVVSLHREVKAFYDVKF